MQLNEVRENGDHNFISRHSRQAAAVMKSTTMEKAST